MIEESYYCSQRRHLVGALFDVPQLRYRALGVGRQSHVHQRQLHVQLRSSMSTSSSTPARRTAAAVGRKPVDADAVLGRTDPDGAASGRVGLRWRGHGRQSLSGRRRVRAVEPVRLGRRPRVVGRCRRLKVDQDGSAEVTRTGPRRTFSSKCPRTPRVRSLAVPDQFLLEVRTFHGPFQTA